MHGGSLHEMTKCIENLKKRKNETCTSSKEAHNNSITSHKREKQDSKRELEDSYYNCSRYCFPVKRKEKQDISATQPYCFFGTYEEYLQAEALNDYESRQHPRN
jgi:hypothetical protein